MNFSIIDLRGYYLCRILRYYFFFFFFSSRRRHTRCSRDWSSDVCSSDLGRSFSCCRCRQRTRAEQEKLRPSCLTTSSAWCSPVEEPCRRYGGNSPPSVRGSGTTVRRYSLPP